MEKRSIGKIIILGLVTFGLYDLYWFGKTRNEMVAKGAKIPSTLVIFAPVLLVFVAGIVLLAVNLMENSSATYGTGDNVSPMTLVFWSFMIVIPIFILAMMLSAYWLWKYCKAVEMVTAGRISFGLAFGLGLLMTYAGILFAWPAFIQGGFNEVPNELSVPAPPQIPSAHDGSGFRPAT